jgi:serine/threonine protein kinase
MTPLSPLSEAKLAERYGNFSDAFSAIKSRLLGISSNIRNHEQTLDLPLPALSPFYDDIAREAESTIVSDEQSNQNWADSLGESLQDQVANLLGGEGPIEIQEVRRMTGGIAVVVSPEEYARLVGAKVYLDGQEVMDGRLKIRALATLPASGFLMAKGESLKRGFPASLRVTLILKSEIEVEGRDFVQEAIAHEEDEIAGEFIEDLISTNKSAQRLERSVKKEGFFSTNFFRTKCIPAMQDIVARIAGGQTFLNLGSLGISPEDIETNRQEVGFIAELINAVRERLRLNGDAESLITALRGSLINPRNILTFLNNRRPRGEIDFSDQFNGLALGSAVEGRFYYNSASLEPQQVLELDGVAYRIGNVIGMGGFSVVYEAFDANGKKYVVKEAYGTAPEIVFSNGYIAPALLDAALDEVTSKKSGAPAIDDVLQAIENKLKPKPEQDFETQAQFADEYMNYLRSQIRQNPTQSPITILKTAMQKFPALNPGEAKLLGFTASNYPEALRAEMVNALALFDAEHGTTQSLYGIEEAVRAIGIVRAVANDPIDKRYQCLYMIQEFAEGSNLSDVLGEWKPFVHKIHFIHSLLTGLEKMHKRGIFHKDIKPANLFLTTDNNVKFVDFGIAKSRAIENASLRKGTTLLGTNVYNSPEHFTGANARADIYSTGMVLYQMLTGDDIQANLDQFGPRGFQQRYDYIKKKLEGRDMHGFLIVPSDIGNTILKAIEPDGSKSFQNAQEMKDALDIESFHAQRQNVLLTRYKYEEEYLKLLEYEKTLPSVPFGDGSLPFEQFGSIVVSGLDASGEYFLPKLSLSIEILHKLVEQPWFGGDKYFQSKMKQTFARNLASKLSGLVTVDKLKPQVIEWYIESTGDTPERESYSDDIVSSIENLVWRIPSSRVKTLELYYDSNPARRANSQDKIKDPIMSGTCIFTNSLAKIIKTGDLQTPYDPSEINPIFQVLFKQVTEHSSLQNEKRFNNFDLYLQTLEQIGTKKPVYLAPVLEHIDKALQTDLSFLDATVDSQAKTKLRALKDKLSNP